PETVAVPTLSIAYNEDASLSAAQALLGSDVLYEDDTARYYSSFSSKAGAFQIYRSGALQASLPAVGRVNDPAGAAVKILQSIGVTAAVSDIAQDGVQQTVTLTQSLFGLPVYPAQVSLIYQDGVLTTMDGTAYLGTLSRVTERNCMNCAEALVALLASRDALDWTGTRILSAQQGYRRADAASISSIRLEPVWRVATDAGDFQINGITGEVSIG
ncbi:MAG: hypothetical protein PHS97_01505, partial [Oscillospiraceae bacterium]|nr:hypothetical protein [Oscillospiraceae bacterium]